MLRQRTLIGSGVARQHRPWHRVSWWYSLLFVVPLLILVGNFAVSGASRTPTVTLSVTDAFTGEPLVGAEVLNGDQTLNSNQDGQVKLSFPDGSVPVTVQLAGYEPMSGTLDQNSDSRQAIALRPNTLEGTITDEQSGEPISGAVVSAVTDAGPNPTTATTDDDGRFLLTNIPPNARVHIDAGDYGIYEEPIGERTEITVTMRLSVVSGVITGEDGQPIQGAIVTMGDAQAVTTADGSYRLAGVPDGGEIAVSAPGFGDARMEMPADRKADFALASNMIKGIYANLSILAEPGGLDGLIEIIEETELNAIVIDIKQDTIYYDSNVQFFVDVGVVQPVFDLDEAMAKLKERNIYTIARMVVFQDPLVAYERRDLAVLDNRNGDLWRNEMGIGWVNAFEEELWHANIDLALEAIERGFDEIQYDYVRFPSDGDMSTAEFGRPYTAEARQDAITEFMRLSYEAIQPTGAKLAADLFGFITIVDDEQGIGQQFSMLEPYLDYVCMMIYPSHFTEGNIASAPGHPNDYPYETIMESLERAEQNVPGSSHKFRPWLQDFNYGGLRPYDAADVRAQIDAAEDFGAHGWMLWGDPRSISVEALKPAS